QTLHVGLEHREVVRQPLDPRIAIDDRGIALRQLRLQSLDLDLQRLRRHLRTPSQITRDVQALSRVVTYFLLGRRRHCRACKPSTSKPPSSNANCSSRYSTFTTSASAAGQAKVPRSRRFASTHVPDSSQTRTFILFLEPLQKKNRSRDIGSSCSRSRTMPAKPLNDFRMSVGPATRKIRPPVNVSTTRAARSGGSGLRPRTAAAP